MPLKVTPESGARYWTAILVASMCGTNMGDFMLGALKLGTGFSLVIWVLLFSAVVGIERMTRRGSEAFYWLAILVVRGAATNIADFSIISGHRGYIDVSVALAVLLAGLIRLNRRWRPAASAAELPPTGGFYWITMLTAGSLGTVIGDGFGHAFHAVHGVHSICSIRIGLFVSAGLASAALALILGLRRRFVLLPAASYWVAIVAVRWWGTNLGDMLAHLLSLSTSMIVTGVVLALVLLFWHSSATADRGGLSPLRV